jgi:hypothetical protein
MHITGWMTVTTRYFAQHGAAQGAHAVKQNNRIHSGEKAKTPEGPATVFAWASGRAEHQVIDHDGGSAPCAWWCCPLSATAFSGMSVLFP